MKSCNSNSNGNTFQRSPSENSKGVPKTFLGKANLTDYNSEVIVSAGNEKGQNKILKNGTYKLKVKVPYLGEDNVYLQNESKSVRDGKNHVPVKFKEIQINDIQTDGKNNKKTASIKTRVQVDRPISAKKVIQTASLLGAGKAKEDVYFEEITELKNIDKLTLISVIIGAIGTAWVLFK
jgi:hypothetical protein